MNNKLNVYIIEIENNEEILNCINKRVNIIKTYSYIELEQYIEKVIDVVIVAKIKNINVGLQIVDQALLYGKEIICIKGSYEKDSYLSRHLSKDGAITI